uniref:Transposase IS4-like domain-containing protein n=1 Tax=Aliivibrio wodanis TaxID=80852 RepID=A0A5Q4ZPE5_9GAMM|nr:hypothetical protein AW0309160_00207 [Aliivibrio wodanis]
MDGKTARRSFSTRERKNALHVVSAWSCEHQLVLRQVAVDDKSNEITAIPEPLSMLDIENTIITLDAMGCQVKIAQQIVDQKGDYLLAVKGNQGRLNEAFNQHFNVVTLSKYDSPSYSTEKKAHGRTEKRM